MTKISIPRMGTQYTELMRKYLESLGLDIQLPPKTTERTISLGVKNSPQMICYPFKQTLGNMIEALERGADTLLMYNTEGICKFRHYWIAQRLILEDLGYQFEMVNLSPRSILPTLRRLSGQSYFSILKRFLDLYKELRKIDQEKEQWSTTKPNVGILGEIFCSCDNDANFDLERKLEDYGANPVNTSTLSEFIKESIRSKIPFLRDKKRKYKKQAEQYLNGPLGGHGYENIYNLLYLIDRGIDGIIHILPLSCSPESIAEIPINHICRDKHIPLLRIPVDENSAEANLDTRIETYCELLRLKKDK